MRHNQSLLLKECMTAMGIAVNIAGAFIAANLHLPVYMDSIGTIMNASLLGPGWAMITGVLGSLASGVLFDVYSLYYAPVQLITGCLAGLLFRGPWMKGRRIVGRDIFIFTAFVAGKRSHYGFCFRRHYIFRLVFSCSDYD